MRLVSSYIISTICCSSIVSSIHSKEVNTRLSLNLFSILYISFCLLICFTLFYSCKLNPNERTCCCWKSEEERSAVSLLKRD